MHWCLVCPGRYGKKRLGNAQACAALEKADHMVFEIAIIMGMVMVPEDIPYAGIDHPVAGMLELRGQNAGTLPVRQDRGSRTSSAYDGVHPDSWQALLAQAMENARMQQVIASSA